MDKKTFLLDWQKKNRIPGKIHAIFTAPAENAGDWRIVVESAGPHRRLKIVTPARGLPTPGLVSALHEYLGREHMRYLRKSALQFILRADGKGAWMLVVQARLQGPQSGHAFNVLREYLQRHHPEVFALHRLETRPWKPFSPNDPPRAMRYDLKPEFGPEFLSLPSGHLVHALDWMPLCREPYLRLPEKLLNAIHPSPGDCLLETHCASAYLSCALAGHFKTVLCADPRSIARISAEHNIRKRKLKNVHFLAEKADTALIRSHLDPKERWTVILNPPNGEALPPGMIKAFAHSPAERVIHISSDLDICVEEIRRWRRAGFLLRKMIPLDLNPASPDVEVALFLAPDREGILRRFVPRPADPDVEELTPENPPVRFVQRKSSDNGGKTKFPRKRPARG